ncbi:MAG: ABC transporter ATP-binding protein [Micropruina sp.]|uniref:ABC transporter ATP-binding protein n=1 Tax=Micropruina sp. TaxID=2737536 RepID=UPI0039E2E3F8
MGINRLRPRVQSYRVRVAVMLVGDVVALVVQMIVPLVLAGAIDGPVATGDVDGLWRSVWILVGLMVLEALAFLARFLPTPDGANLEYELRTDLFGRLLRQRPSYHHQTGTGHAVARLVGDVEQIGFWYTQTSAMLVSTVASLVAATVMMVAIQPVLGVAALAALSPLTWAMWRARNQMRQALADARRCAGDLAAASEESAVGVRVWKGVGGGPSVRARFDRLSGLARDARMLVVDASSRSFGVTQGYPMLVLAGLIVAGIALVAHGVLSVGELVAFAAYFGRVQFPLTALGFNLATIQAVTVAAERLGDAFDTDERVRGPQEPAPMPVGGGARLHFDDVHFSYPDADAPVLSGVDLEVGAGETVALVGATGSGKSTLASLVNRLADPTSGRVLIDGRDVRDLDPAELRAQVGVAFEEAVLFSHKVTDNLWAGRPGVTERRMAEAIDVVQARFVDDLPDGRDTVVGERGLTLSGGQRQRLALGRALLGRPRVLILDDPTSALDVRTEAALLGRLREVVAGTTTLLIARRPTTAMLADRVAVLQDGRVVAVGSHQELLKTSAEYRRVMIADDQASAHDQSGADDQSSAEEA